MREQPVKVFYMVYSLTSGGIERYSVNLFSYINPSKFQLDFITKLDRKEFFDEKFTDMGGTKIPLYHTDNSGLIKQRFLLLKNAYRLARKGYKVAYFNLSSPKEAFKYPLIARLAGIKKIIIHSHNSFDGNEKNFYKILNSFGRRLIKLISTDRLACSDKAAGWMFGSKVKKNKNYTFIQNGINLSKYTFNNQTRESMRSQNGLDENDFVVGHIGRFEKQKNHIFLIKVFCELLNINENAKLILVGAGSKEQEIKKMVTELGINKSVFFLGERNDIPDLLKMFDVFVLPSLYEGLPVVGIEAQAADLPCVFSDTITRESDVTGNITFLALQDSVVEWAQVIQDKKKNNRHSREEDLRKKGFDIKHSAELVEQIFDNGM